MKNLSIEDEDEELSESEFLHVDSDGMNISVLF